MLKTKDLLKYRNILNIKELCNLAGVKYYNVIHKMHRHKWNSNRGELTYYQSRRLGEALNQAGISLKRLENKE